MRNLAIGLLISALSLVAWSIHMDNVRKDNLNINATHLRGSSICEKHSESLIGVQIGAKLGRRGNTSDKLLQSVVSCINKGTGKITDREFQTVLYREPPE